MVKWREKIGELFGIDIRSLALFRIGLALIILGDLLVRVQDLKAHYTDEGVLPRGFVSRSLLDKWQWSLHLANGTWEFEFILFLLAGLFGLALLIGYKTRLAAILSWFFLISLQLRNPMILQGGDIVLKVLLFWAMFLPLGAYLSVDRYRSKNPLPATPIVSMGTAALLLQVCFIYWFSALLKTDGTWRHEGTAIWYALMIEQYSTPLGLYLLHFPAVLKIMTFATFFLEAFGPFFAFSPIWTGPLRLFTAIVFTLFHLIGLNFTMELALFPYVCAVAWIAFIPTWFWAKVLRLKWPGVILWKASWISNAVASFFLVYILLWNISTLDLSIPPFIPPPKSIGNLLAVDQTWDMFAPTPLREDGWYIIPGNLRDGTVVDLYTDGKPVNWKKPESLSAAYPNDHWRSYMMNLELDEFGQKPMLYFARYLCRKWNENHSYAKQMISFDVIFMLKINSLENPQPHEKKTVLWHQECRD